MASIQRKKSESLIMRYLNQILKKEFRHEPLIENIIFIEVILSSDNQAKVFYRHLTNVNKHKETDLFLKHNCKKITYYLSQLVSSRRLPKLRFCYDESLEHGNVINEIIDKLKQNPKD